MVYLNLSLSQGVMRSFFYFCTYDLEEQTDRLIELYTINFARKCSMRICAPSKLFAYASHNSYEKPTCLKRS